MAYRPAPSRSYTRRSPEDAGQLLLGNARAARPITAGRLEPPLDSTPAVPVAPAVSPAVRPLAVRPCSGHFGARGVSVGFVGDGSGEQSRLFRVSSGMMVLQNLAPCRMAPVRSASSRMAPDRLAVAIVAFGS